MSLGRRIAKVLHEEMKDRHDQHREVSSDTERLHVIRRPGESPHRVPDCLHQEHYSLKA